MVDTLKWSRWLRRMTLPVALVLGFLLYRNYGWIRVPEGMDTVAAVPAGSLCLIDKRPGVPVPGAIVFVRLPDGSGDLMGVVERVEGQWLHLRADVADSAYAGRLAAQPFTADAVRGLVLSAFGTGRAEPENRDGR